MLLLSFPFAIILTSRSSATSIPLSKEKRSNVYHTIHPTSDPISQTGPKNRRHLFHRKVQSLRRAGLYFRQAGPFSKTRQAEDRMSRTVRFILAIVYINHSLQPANTSIEKATPSHTWQQPPKAQHGKNPAISP